MFCLQVQFKDRPSDYKIILSMNSYGKTDL